MYEKIKAQRPQNLQSGGGTNILTDLAHWKCLVPVAARLEVFSTFCNPETMDSVQSGKTCRMSFQRGVGKNRDYP